MIQADLHAANPHQVALALAPYGMKLFLVHGVRPRIGPEGVALVCTCARNAGETCYANAPGKHPIRRSWQASASDVEAVLRGRAAMHPQSNVAVACGAPSRLVIIDVDGPTGLESFKDAENRLGALPDTVVSRSGREGVGFHLWLRLRHDDPVPRNKSSTVLGSGVDVRAGGGLAIIPGSRHKSGRRYQWVRAPDEMEFAELPRAWLAALTAVDDARKISGDARPNVRRFSRPTHEQGSRLIGDGPGRGGFDGPLYRNACAFLYRWPEASDDALIDALRAAVEAAPKEGRDVTRYLSDAYLRRRVTSARAFVEGSRE